MCVSTIENKNNCVFVPLSQPSNINLEYPVWEALYPREKNVQKKFHFYVTKLNRHYMDVLKIAWKILEKHGYLLSIQAFHLNTTMAHIC